MKNRVLILLALAAELQQAGPDRGVVDPRQVAADLILGEPGPRSRTLAGSS